MLGILFHALPDAPAMLHGNALGGKQDLLFTDVGKMIQDVGISPLKQFGIYEKSITAINISQCPAVAVGFLSVVNQPEFPAVDQFAIHRLGRTNLLSYGSAQESIMRGIKRESILNPPRGKPRGMCCL